MHSHEHDGNQESHENVKDENNGEKQNVIIFTLFLVNQTKQSTRRLFLAVRIRLQRLGRKKRPYYRLVAADARAQRDGVFLERLGHYNPITEPADVEIDEEKALKWLRRGAQPSDTAKRLLSQQGIWKKFTYEKLGKPLPDAEESATDEPPEETEISPSEDEQEVLHTEDTPEPVEENSESTEAASESSEEE